MLIWIFAVLALFVIQTILPFGTRYLENLSDLGSVVKASSGGRDQLPALSQNGARAERALNNLKEAMPVFLTLAVLLQMQMQQNVVVTSTAILGAQIFLVCRILYIPAYIISIPGIRSTIWMVSVGGLLMMAVALWQCTAF